MYMADVEFFDDPGSDIYHYRSRKLIGDLETPAMVRLMKRTGLIRTEKAAGYVLVGLAVFNFLLAAVIFLSV